MAITFHKMHGLGNDFVLLDLREEDIEVDSGLANRLADRNYGVGCDQVIVLRETDNPDYLGLFEFWNADGSRAEQCGNGVRSIGHYLHRRGETPAGSFQLKGPAGVVIVECLDDGQVRVDMGEPQFSADKVPVKLPFADGWYLLAVDAEEFRLGAVSMGNPHALMLVEDIDSVNVAELGARIGADAGFPQGCNVGFAQVINRSHIRLRVYERGGVGETRACGSGSCAAVSILRKHAMVEANVRVTQAGGSLIIEWTGEGKPVMMTGSATYVFKGKFYE